MSRPIGQSAGAWGAAEMSLDSNFRRAFAFLKARNYVGAIREFSAVADIAEKLQMFEQLAASLCGLADANKRNNDFAASEKALQRAVDVTLKFLDEQSISQGLCLAALGELYVAIGKADEGVDLLEKATLIFWSQRDSFSTELMPGVTACFRRFLRACIDTEQFEKADCWSRDIYDFSKRRFGEADLQTIMTLHICLFCAQFLEQKSRVESILSDARQMSKAPSRFNFTNKLNLKVNAKTLVQSLENVAQGFHTANCVGEH